MKFVHKFDPRLVQIMYLTSFLLLGIIFLHWENKLAVVFSIMIASNLFQAIFSKLVRIKIDLKSSTITGLGLSLLLNTYQIEIGILSALIAIGSKFIIRHHGKHIFNPANLGVIFPSLVGIASVAPGQWGSNAVYLLTISCISLLLLLRVNRFDACISFLLSTFLINYGYQCLWKGWPLDFVTHGLTNGSLILFTFFMITDPKTTPNAPKARILFGVIVALLSFAFQQVLYMNAGAPLFALFIVSPLTVLFDKIFVYKTFEWNKQPDLQQISKHN